ncbi:MAG TPA: DUF6338 family protein [Terracidiphilus sp.]|jgi:hypothetical protein|nr:DUF6338 family protein [Terracidiphilus sp.]
MPSTLLALQLLLILLPGFSAAYVVQALATRRQQSDLERVIEALVFSFVIYVCYIPINGGRLPFSIAHDASGKSEDTVLWQLPQLAWLVAVTAAFTVLSVAYARIDGNRLLRLISLTERTTNNSIWNDIFEHEATPDQIVQVELGDKRSVLGVLLYYSDAAEDCSLFLMQASWVGEDGSTIPIPGQGILLTKASDIRSVSLLSKPDQDAEQPMETEEN